MILIGCILSRASRAQDFHFSQFIPNMVYVNPACVAMPTAGEVELTYRNQWPGIPATFVTYGASFILPMNALNSGIGVSLINDMQGSGVINLTTASFLYGYRFKVNAMWQVGAGIGATYAFKKFNADELVFRSDILNDLGYGYTTTVFDSYTRSYPDFSVGLVASNNGILSFGFSASHVTRPRDSFSERQESRLPLKYTAFVRGRIGGGSRSSAGSLVFEPAAFFSQQKQNHELIWGSQVLFAGNFMVGGWIRQNLGLSFESLILAAGISWGHYNISYSYDVNLKKLRFMSTKMAAHEVTFLYRFEYNDRKFRKTECPAYL